LAPFIPPGEGIFRSFIDPPPLEPSCMPIESIACAAAGESGRVSPGTLSQQKINLKKG
jgi:hypothetical protein